MFGRRIEPRLGLSFADLVLPTPNQRQLQELRTRIRSISQVAAAGFEARMTLGKGLIGLFTGSSGTGKTMAAELLAREQGVDLFKVDLSSVVSKWVGETEKNLASVFAEAEAANAIIFFDEADALFGKRGEVRQSQDRWANMEINYLLQRVEEYAGVVILATNLRQNIDEAFLRRIHVIVEFPAPDSAARLRILQGLFPPGIKRPGDAELSIVAEQFRISGGSLKNIVLDAAFRAFDEAGSGAPSIELRHLIVATGREYQKLGRPMTRSEFGDDLYPYLEQYVL
jgi:SpoVK/Ycf46/Vps4 family AAA+-type ATPase